jgi:hypothetical protein
MTTKAETNLGLKGQGPWQYTVLSGDWLTDELRRLSAPTSVGSADAVTFQPCANVRSQDRYTIQEWDIGASGQTWKFAAVFDGPSFLGYPCKTCTYDCFDAGRSQDTAARLLSTTSPTLSQGLFVNL